MTGNIVQSTYGRYMSAGSPGAAATMHGWDADTKTAEGNIVFGRVVSKGVADDGVVQAGTLFVGVSMRDITQIHDTADRYELGNNVAVMTRGDIWVRAKEAVVVQTAVKYDTSTGELGKAAGTAISGAIWKTSAGAGEMAICRLNGGEDLTT